MTPEAGRYAMNTPPRRQDGRPQPARRSLAGMGGFTLVELMVVGTVIAVLTTLSVAGLAATRQRVRADKTRARATS